MSKQIKENNDTMHVLLVKPDEVPREVELGTDLASMQQAVGGYIQAVYPDEAPVAIVCNEEGKLNDLPLNRAFYDDEGRMYDIIAGDFIVCGLDDEDFTSLLPEHMEKYTEQFKCPEKFVRLAGEIVAVKLPVIDATEKKQSHSGPEL